MTDELILQAREMQKRMIATTLPGELADALEAQARRIAELETKVIDDRKVMALNLALIEKQAWRIAELKAALKPFDEMLQRDFSFMANDERYYDDFTAKVLMRLGDLRAARAAYLGEKK